jgi:hypothetical protein
MSSNYLVYAIFLFTIVTFATVILFFIAVRKHKIAWGFVLAILGIQGILAYQNFYLESPDTLPPRVALLAFPSFFLMLLAFFTEKGKAIIATIDLAVYTYLHTVRIVVEIGLFLLFKAQLLPQSMTFEGRNFDILAGLSAPLVAFFFFSQKAISKQMLLIWNVLCLLLVLQVVTTGILAVPSPFQQLDFGQPNVAVLRFPFVWLPSVIVPIVIFGHLVSIKRLLT